MIIKILTLLVFIVVYQRIRIHENRSTLAGSKNRTELFRNIKHMLELIMLIVILKFIMDGLL